MPVTRESDHVLWTLPAECNIYQVAELKTELQAALEPALPLKLALDAVEDLDTSVIQLLLVARRACDEAALPFALLDASPACQEALRVLGLDPASLQSLHGALQ